MTRFRFLYPTLLLSLPASLYAADESKEWRALFNGKDFTGWTPVVQKQEPGKDPERYAEVRDGVIHMYPDTDPAASVQFGYVVHNDTFSRYHLTFEYQWGEKKFIPRKDAIRDAGLLLHVHNTLKVWPDSLEYQIQEGDSADIVMLTTGGLTWKAPEPDKAPEGQGEPGMLPEQGGYPVRYKNDGFAYIGRFPELDRLKGWNRVDVIVQADESAEFLINGQTRSRVTHLMKKDGTPLREGKIGLQLEGAELQYRDVRIKELKEPLRADRGVVSLSAVKDKPAVGRKLTLLNPGGEPVPASFEIFGKDAAAFKVTGESSPLAGGAGRTLEITFQPNRGADRYSAGLRIGDAERGTFVILQGIGLDAFEGKNEATLQSIVYALGIPLNVGGTKLELDTKPDKIGDSVAATHFAATGKEKIRVTPLARYSPPGETPFGLLPADGGEAVEIGRLATSAQQPDSHQSLLPPLADGKPFAEIAAPAGPFSFWMKGPKFTSSTVPGPPPGASLTYTARVYPVTRFQGRKLENAWLVGFEEAANGDYQDAVFLLENVSPKAP